VSFSQDVVISDNRTSLNAIRVKAEYVRLLKEYRGGQIGDAWKLVDNMETTRDLAETWKDLPPVTVYGTIDSIVDACFSIG